MTPSKTLCISFRLQDKCSDETTNKDHNGQKNNQSNTTIEKGKTTKVNISMSSRSDDSQLHTQLSMVSLLTCAIFRFV